MKWPILKIKTTSRDEFIEFWSNQYQYPNEDSYNSTIGKPLTAARIWQLFEWKNGGPIAAGKKKSIQKNYIEANEKAPLKGTPATLETYLNKSGGAIWRIFWLHCQGPKQFPIYDQHVHRAMAKLKGWETQEIPAKNSLKVKMYLDEYLPFWKEFKNQNPRKVDQALWSFGKYIKLNKF